MESCKKRALIIGGVFLVVALVALIAGLALTNSGGKESDEETKLETSMFGNRIMGPASLTNGDSNSIEFDLPSNKKDLNTNSIEFNPPSNEKDFNTNGIEFNGNRKTTWKPPKEGGIVFPGSDPKTRTPNLDGSRVNFGSNNNNIGNSGRPNTRDGSAVRFPSSFNKNDLGGSKEDFGPVFGNNNNIGTSASGRNTGRPHTRDGSAVRFPSSSNNNNLGGSNEDWGVNGDTIREDFGPPVNPGLGTRMGTVVGRCELPMVVGTCRALVPSWYFDAQTGACGQFTYRGCSGNENRFSSKEECRRVCVTDSESVEDF